MPSFRRTLSISQSGISSGWTCVFCTYRNKESSRLCQVCGCKQVDDANNNEINVFTPKRRRNQRTKAESVICEFPARRERQTDTKSVTNEFRPDIDEQNMILLPPDSGRLLRSRSRLMNNLVELRDGEIKREGYVPQTFRTNQRTPSFKVEQQNDNPNLFSVHSQGKTFYIEDILQYFVEGRRRLTVEL